MKRVLFGIIASFIIFMISSCANSPGSSGSSNSSSSTSSLMSSITNTNSNFIYTISGSTATIIGNTLGNNPVTTLVIPATINGYTVANIGPGSFYGTAIYNLTVSSGVKNISTKAFSMCQDLQYITIPSSVTNIGDYAFQTCVNLHNVVLPTGLISIGVQSFAGCDMGGISLPSTLISIGDDAFDSCSLTSVYDYATTPQTIDATIFGNNGCSIVVSVPDGGSPTYVSLYTAAWLTPGLLPAGSTVVQQ